MRITIESGLWDPPNQVLPWTQLQTRKSLVRRRSNGSAKYSFSKQVREAFVRKENEDLTLYGSWVSRRMVYLFVQAKRMEKKSLEAKICTWKQSEKVVLRFYSLQWKLFHPFGVWTSLDNVVSSKISPLRGFNPIHHFDFTISILVFLVSPLIYQRKEGVIEGHS